MGRNEFRLDVNNLFFNLPCTFHRGTVPGSQDDCVKVLDIGDELYQSDQHRDLPARRSGEFQLTDYVGIFREAQGALPRWGEFQWMKADLQAGQALDPSVWPHGITAILEVTSNLDLFLLLFRDRPHYVVDGPGPSLSVWEELEARSKRSSRFRRGQGGQAPLDPSRIMVNAYSSDGKPQPKPVFSVLDDGDHFPETFHSGDGRAERRGAIGTLGDPPENHQWTFHYRDDDGELEMIGALSQPLPAGQLNIRYHATVDAEGSSGCTSERCRSGRPNRCWTWNGGWAACIVPRWRSPRAITNLSGTRSPGSTDPAASVDSLNRYSRMGTRPGCQPSAGPDWSVCGPRWRTPSGTGQTIRRTMPHSRRWRRSAHCSKATAPVTTPSFPAMTGPSLPGVGARSGRTTTDRSRWRNS